MYLGVDMCHVEPCNYVDFGNTPDALFPSHLVKLFF